jgi:chaperone required for assembly of F1-ATPase
MTDDQPKNTRPLPFGAIPTLLKDLLPHAGEDIDPVAMARKDLKSSLPRRFWTRVEVKQQPDGFGIALDDRLTKTPARKPLLVPSRALAEHLAQEWHAIAEVIDPAQMPLTRLVNSALDGVSLQMDEVQADAARYAGSDLLCYRAEMPDRLVALQQDQWGPLLAWAESEFGARLHVTQGLFFVEQPDVSLAAIRQAVVRFDHPLTLAAFHTLTTLTGSVILALALAHRRLKLAEVWALAHLDEDFQMEVWGQDEEALTRRAAKWREAEVAALVLSLLLAASE